jgi:hypothetical protein
MVLTQNLLNGNSKSCGCWNREKAAERTKIRNRTHGLSDTPEYMVYHGMKTRCYDERDQRYIQYGARGIAMCDRWRESFEAFYADMGPRPSAKHSIDRIDNDGPYAPENCRWATMKEQMHNQQKTLRQHGVAGADNIAAIEGVKKATIYHRRWVAKQHREQR